MDTAMVGALSGVLGSLIGGTATAATTWVSQNRLNRREVLREELRKREALYGEFIGECARLLMDALGHSLEKPETLLPAYALLNRIRLCASQPVLVQAEELTRHITDQYFARNLTVEEFRGLAHSKDADPLRSFGEACRAELKSLRGRI